MSARENRLRGEVVKALKKAGLMAFAVENIAQPGTPDVHCVLGWIELKSVDAPKRERTLFRVPHFTEEQRWFLRERWALKEDAWLLLRTGREWLLFDGASAAEYLGRVTLAELRPHAFPLRELADLAGALRR